MNIVVLVPLGKQVASKVSCRNKWIVSEDAQFECCCYWDEQEKRRNVICEDVFRKFEVLDVSKMTHYFKTLHGAVTCLYLLGLKIIGACTEADTITLESSRK